MKYYNRTNSLKNNIVRCYLTTIHHQNSDKPTIPTVLLRHGQSTWNQQNIFIGMTDTLLTDDGIQEAIIAGKLLRTNPRICQLDVVYSSLVRRPWRSALSIMGKILSRNGEGLGIFPLLKCLEIQIIDPRM
jgi:hypothetical protein